MPRNPVPTQKFTKKKNPRKMFTDFGPWTSPFFDQGHFQDTILVGLCSRSLFYLAAQIVARSAAKYSSRHDCVLSLAISLLHIVACGCAKYVVL